MRREARAEELPPTAPAEPEATLAAEVPAHPAEPVETPVPPETPAPSHHAPPPPPPALVAEKALGHAFMAVADTPLAATVSNAATTDTEADTVQLEATEEDTHRPFWDSSAGEKHFKVLREVVSGEERRRQSVHQHVARAGALTRFNTEIRNYTCHRCGRVFHHPIEYCPACQNALARFLAPSLCAPLHRGTVLGAAGDRVELSVVALEEGWPARLFVSLHTEPVFVRYRDLLAVVMGARTGYVLIRA